eukprot:11608376-Heterocapsa_arctica.AAC.1
MDMQSFDGAEIEPDLTVIRVLYSHDSKWGNRPNHYDLLHPHVEVIRERTKLMKEKTTILTMNTEKEKLDTNV